MHNESIDYAVERFQNFLTVNKQKAREIRLEAVDYFALAVDIDDENWDHLAKKLGDLVESPGGELGWAIIGFLMGLYTAQREEELRETSNRDASL